jgi:hypothetical protein
MPTKVSVSGVNDDLECFERADVLWASASHEDVSVLIEFDATGGLTERVAWVEGGWNVFG